MTKDIPFVSSDGTIGTVRIWGTVPDTTPYRHVLVMRTALKGLVAADACNYDRDTMRAQGLFDAARAAISEAES